MERTELTYDGLCEMIEACVVPISYEALKDRKKMLVIAISEEVRFQKSVQKMVEQNPEIELIIVAQTQTAAVLEDIYQGKYKVVSWSGKYTTALIDRVKEEAGLDGLDGFTFYTQHEVNLRDKNFIEIASCLQEEKIVHVYSDSVGYELYEYHNLPLYSQGIKVYEDINRLIDLKFSRAIEEDRV